METSKNINQATESVSNKYKEGVKSFDKWPQYSEVKELAEEGLESTFAIVKKYPLYSLLGAAAIGVIAGSLISRSRQN